MEFSAVAIVQLPGLCGPEEINICAVVDRQDRTDVEIVDLMTKVASISSVDGSFRRQRLVT